MRTTFGLMMLLGIAIAGCASSPPVQQQQQVVMAADNGQPRMQAALQALTQARAVTEAAAPNKGGHRQQAISLIQQAIDAVNAGMQFAAAHPSELGPAEGAAAPEPVNEVVPGAERQPRMAQAMVELREARKQLHEARRDKGGHRQRALELIQEAMIQLREGINFANGH